MHRQVASRGVAHQNEQMGGGQISPRLFSAIKMSASKQATMKDGENYIVDFFEFSGPNEKHHFEGEINLRLSLDK